MATRKYKPSESGQATPKSDLHEAAITLGSEGGKAGGPARAAVLSEAERHRIAKMGGEARGRQEGKTTRKGQKAQKAASPSGQATRAQPAQPKVGSFAGPGYDPAAVDYGHDQGHLGMVEQIARHLDRPPAPRTRPAGDPTVGPAVQGYFDQATRAMGRGSNRPVAGPGSTPSIGNQPAH